MAVKRLWRRLVAFIDRSEDVYEYLSLEDHFPGAVDLAQYLVEDEPISETAEDAWGDGWVEITVLGDEYRRFRTSDGKVIEVPFGEHQEEEDG